MPQSARSDSPWAVDHSEDDNLFDTRWQADAAAAEILTPSYAAIHAHARSEPRCGLLAKANLGLLLCAVLLALYFSFQADRTLVLRWLNWARHHPVEGRTLFVLVYSASMVAMVPGSLLALLAGAHLSRSSMARLQHVGLHARCRSLNPSWSTGCFSPLQPGLPHIEDKYATLFACLSFDHGTRTPSITVRSLCRSLL